MRLIDLNNQRFGKLLVKRRAKNLGRDVAWLCLCDCGVSKTIRSGDLRSGHTQSCGCNWRRKGSNHPQWTGCGGISGQFWSHIKIDAHNRNITFDLSIDQAWGLFIQQDCRCALTGCDIHFNQSSQEFNVGVGTASLDRIDSQKSYCIDNVQWVHKHINYIKRDLQEDYFIQLCRDICNHADTPGN